MERHIKEELPFIATENILMDAVSRGGDRQELHEAIRQKSQLAAKNVKLHGGENNLLELIAEDARFGLKKEDFDDILDIYKYVGCAPQQTEEFLNEYVRPIIAENSGLLGVKTEINV